MELENRPPVSTRLQGLLLFVFGLLVGGPLVYGLYLYLQKVEHGFGILVFLAVIPVFIGLIGFLELVTGIPFSQLETRWKRLKRWQRGIFGVLVAIAVYAAGSVFSTAFF